MARHLYVAIGERKGNETGSGYVDREVAKAIAEMTEYLEKNYNIA
jgi:hypothetical protein